ncbi:hypothetical protein [Kosakonia sp. R1.Fl]|uniref:hypothetical protein n=1 Tax=Kosakonia sp. R1.Fl TaxID=2928706 RepID=UPI00201E0120|nr:hypothetical protein [Kosakonia sp. R1.Fl]MCL6745081.1 hypothetical protein [Kosakonia sp. R1.Fl]
MTAKLSRQELETVLTQCRNYHADCIAPVSVRKVETMARMLLAGMSREPVADIREDLGRLFVHIKHPTNLKAGDVLYAAPPAPVAAPECFRNAVSALESLYRNGQKQCWNERYTTDMAYASGVLNACRAAMQAEPVTAATVPGDLLATFTRKRLLQIIVTGPDASGAEQNILARIALSLMPLPAAPEQEV